MSSLMSSHQRERVQTDVLGFGKFDERAAQVAAGLFIGAADVDDPDLGADAQVRHGDFVQKHGFAGTGGAGDRDVVVAGGVVVHVEVHDLPASPARTSTGVPVPCHSPMSGARWIAFAVVLVVTRLSFFRSSKNRVESAHRQAGNECLRDHERIVGELEAARAPEGARRLFGASNLRSRGEEHQLVVEVHQVRPVAERLEHRVPVLFLVVQIGQKPRHGARGVGGCARGLEKGPVLRCLRLQDMHAQRDHEGARILQRALIEIADQCPHVPKREARWESS